MHIRSRQRRSLKTRRHVFTSTTLFQKPPIWVKKPIEHSVRITNPYSNYKTLELHCEDFNDHDVYAYPDWRQMLTIGPRSDSNIITLEKSYYNEIPLEEIYGIPQKTWDQFINYLPNKKVVKLLNISNDRHLWPGYSYCVSPLNKQKASEELNRKRAELITTHPFLLPLVAYYSRAMYLPALWSWADEEKKVQLKQEIEQQLSIGQFDINAMKQLSPYYTKSFFKKINQCSHNKTTHLWIELIDSYAKVKTGHSKVTPTSIQDRQEEVHTRDRKRLLAAIDWMPSSQTEPEKFYRAAELADACRGRLYHSHEFMNVNNNMRGRLFFNSRKHWQAENPDNYAMHRIFERRDRHIHYFDALFRDLVLRFVLQHLEQGNERNETIIARVKAHFIEVLADTLTVNQLNALVIRWERNIEVIAAKKPKLIDGFTWLPLIHKTKIDATIIRAITSERALRALCEEMSHSIDECLASVTRNNCDILETISADGTKSMIKLRYKDDHIFAIQQHVLSYYQKDIQQSIATQLIEMLNAKKIAINDDRLKYRNKYIVPHPYDVNNLVMQQEIYQVYVDTQTLPTKLQAKNYQHMLEKTGLAEFLRVQIDGCDAKNPAAKSM